MKIPTINKFLCFDLMTGGLILSYVGAVSNAIYAMLLISNLIVDPELFRQEILAIVENAENLSPSWRVFEDDATMRSIEESQASLYLTAAAVAIIMATLCICLVISLLAVHAIHEVC